MKDFKRLQPAWMIFLDALMLIPMAGSIVASKLVIVRCFYQGDFDVETSITEEG